MTDQSRLAQFVFVAVLVAGASATLADTHRAPAGQMCSAGSYVIGFDSDSNIICSEAGKITVLDTAETSEVEKAAAQGDCAPACQPENVAKDGVDRNAADEGGAAKIVAVNTGAAASIAVLSISDVEPSTVLFGTRKVDVTVIGTGFTPASVVIFAGKKYSSSIDQAGTRLVFTVITRELSIGPYAVKVSNGSGAEVTLKRALEIY